MPAPIIVEDLDAIIRSHQDTLWSHRWQMSPAAQDLITQTIKALKHYRDLLAVIDNRPKEPEPATPEPTLPPVHTATIKEQL